MKRKELQESRDRSIPRTWFAFWAPICGIYKWGPLLNPNKQKMYYNLTSCEGVFSNIFLEIDDLSLSLEIDDFKVTHAFKGERFWSLHFVLFYDFMMNLRAPSKHKCIKNIDLICFKLKLCKISCLVANCFVNFSYFRYQRQEYVHNFFEDILKSMTWDPKTHVNVDNFKCNTMQHLACNKLRPTQEVNPHIEMKLGVEPPNKIWMSRRNNSWKCLHKVILGCLRCFDIKGVPKCYW